MLFVITLTGLASFLGLAAFLLLSSAVELVYPHSGAGTDTGTDFVVAWGLGFSGLALLPAVLYSFQRMNGKAIRPFIARPIKVWQGLVLAVVWIGAILLSSFLDQNMALGWLAAAPFYAISIGVPIVLLVWIGVGGIPLGSRNRFWGSLGIGMTVGPFLGTFLEFFVYMVILAVLFFILALNPDFLSILRHLGAQLHGQTDIDQIMQILAPYLVNPAVLSSLFLGLCVFTPLIEESVKPAVVWVMAKRLQTPAQGFALGAISGAGFALVESLLAASTPGQGWGQLLAARAGGGLMHIFASGVMGWGIASAFQGKRLRLVGTYLVSVMIHGLWNGAAIIIEVGTLQSYLNGVTNPQSSDPYSIFGTAVLGLMVVLILPALILINRKLRQPVPMVPSSPAQSDIIAPL
ncbi:MAG: PrsW family glutamic-type intramembrane protease [Anaerolineales bacterium]